MTLCLKHLSKQPLEEPCWPAGCGDWGSRRSGEGRGDVWGVCGWAGEGEKAWCLSPWQFQYSGSLPTNTTKNQKDSISQAWLKLTAVCKHVPGAQKQFTPFWTKQVTDVHVSQCKCWAVVVISTHCKKPNKPGPYSLWSLYFFSYSFALQTSMSLLFFSYSQLFSVPTLLNLTYLHDSFVPTSSSSPVTSISIRLDLELVFFQVSPIWS